MRIANAGHIPPYRNGLELDLEGSLPLGIDDDATYDAQTLQLAPGDHLTFITDGVIEATNPAKELFGFDRTRDISNQPATAIMEQVQTFGQETTSPSSASSSPPPDRTHRMPHVSLLRLGFSLGSPPNRACPFMQAHRP